MLISPIQSLNQWVLDYENNTRRIIESIKIAKKAGATLRVGPEYSLTSSDKSHELIVMAGSKSVVMDVWIIYSSRIFTCIVGRC